MNPLVDFKGQVKLKDAHSDIVKAVQGFLITTELLNAPKDGIPGPKTLAAFARFKQLEYLEHPDLLGPATAQALLDVNENHSLVKDEPAKAESGFSVYVPGAGQVTSRQMMPGSKRFTWGELTKGLTRLPSTALELSNLIKLARYLDQVSDFLDNRPITITSGFRPLAVNRAVGGASNSQHLYGNAADFVVEGLPPHVVFQRLNTWHGSKGGLGNGATFTHLDLRKYYSRFQYG